LQRVLAGTGIDPNLDELCHSHLARPKQWCDDVDALLERTVASPEGFSSLTGKEASQVDFFEGARYAGGDPNSPSEHILLDYAELPGVWEAGQRDVYFPTFEHSGHPVTLSEPARFFEVSRDFIERTARFAHAH
jgi:hypothetical protein